LTAAGFSLGCMTCFSGAIVATLLVYVGALGSAAVGAAVLFMFSLGVAVPFLAAALYLSRVMPAMTFLARHAPLLGFTGMALIVAFGLVLISDNFHVLSNAIYPFLGLS
jgi:cytochrome c biogenesis protein CcdA